MKTRIDIISGYYGAGKTRLIAKMLRTNQSFGEGAAHFIGETTDTGILAGDLAEAIARKPTARLLLETAGAMLLKDVPALFDNGALAALAYPGTPVFVMDGQAFHRDHDHLHGYYINQIEQATVVFINRLDELNSEEKLAVLGRIWEINRHVHLMVAPLHGLDLWRVLDLPVAPQDADKYITFDSKQGLFIKP